MSSKEASHRYGTSTGVKWKRTDFKMPWHGACRWQELDLERMASMYQNLQSYCRVNRPTRKYFFSKRIETVRNSLKACDNDFTSLSSFNLLLRRSDISKFSSFLAILNLCYHPSQLPIRAFMPWQLVIYSTVFNVSCYELLFFTVLHIRAYDV